MQADFAEAIRKPITGPLAVYRNTVVRGAVEALRGNFPVVEQVIGADMFQAVAVDFAETCPPRSPVLAHYGGMFPDWLRKQPWVEELPYLPDLARVERLRAQSLLAADAHAIADLPPELGQSAGIRLHPAARFAWLQTPAMSIWLAHQQPTSGKIAPEWKAEGALFIRPTPFALHAPRIGRAAHRLLSGMRLGETLAASMAATKRLYPDENASAVLASLVRLGVFVAPKTERTRQ